VDALGRQTQFEYDDNGNQIAKIFPDGSRESQTYDSAGRLTGFVDASGSRTQWMMDGAGRVLATQFADGSSESFTYTPTGLLQSATNSSGTVRYEYDNANRLVKVEYPTGASIEYGYDNLGNRVQVTSKVGAEAPKTTLYEYDALNRLASVTEPDGLKTQYNYDANGNLIKTTLPNGVTTEYSIDVMNRIVGQVLRHEGNIFQTLQYQYNLNGDRVKSVQDSVSLVDYAYDAGRRLISEVGRDQTSSTGYSLTYNYDAVGNRVAMVDETGATTHYSYNVNDQLVSYGSTVLAYDARGNLVSRTKDTTSTVYMYDYENQLIEVDGPSGSIEYRSDATGERLSRTEGGETTHFLVDLNNPTGVSQVAVEYNQQGTTQASYAYGLQLIGQEANGIQRYHHHDANGNVRLLTDSQGQVTDSYSYTAFGVMMETTGTTENHYQFAGERYQDAESLSFFRARSYDAEMGRFISRDPYQGRLAEPVTLHRYLYANSNPISFRDPTGLFSIPELATASSLMGSIQTNYVSALTSVFKSSVEIANDYILVGTKGRELVLDALFVGVWTPGIMNILIDSNDTISNGFKLISKTANNELIKFGFSLFSPLSTVEHTVTKGKFMGLTFQFDLSGPLGDYATSENGEAFITSGGLLNGLVPSFPQLGPLGNLAKVTSSITQKAVLGESVGRESVSQAQGLIKDLINAFRDS
jgi:RHS repeat-associated protein